MKQIVWKQDRNADTIASNADNNETEGEINQAEAPGDVNNSGVDGNNEVGLFKPGDQTAVPVVRRYNLSRNLKA